MKATTQITINLPDKCHKCTFTNLNIWGTRTQGKLKITVRCSRCGKPLWKLEQ